MRNEDVIQQVIRLCLAFTEENSATELFTLTYWICRQTSNCETADLISRSLCESFTGQFCCRIRRIRSDRVAPISRRSIFKYLRMAALKRWADVAEFESGCDQRLFATGCVSRRWPRSLNFENLIGSRLVERFSFRKLWPAAFCSIVSFATSNCVVVCRFCVGPQFHLVTLSVPVLSGDKLRSNA